MPINCINQHRKQIGLYNTKPLKLTDKSFRKAIRKAQNSHESVRTHRGNSDFRTSSLSTVLKIALVAGVVSAAISPAGAMLNGQRNKDPKTGSTVPLMGSTEGVFGGGGACTSWKISKNALVTAKHCVDKNYPWGYIGGSIWSWDYATHKADHPDKSVDLSILRFENYPLAGFTYCIPMMSQETFKILKESPKDICGDEGRLIVAGRGVSPEIEELFTGRFDFYGDDSPLSAVNKTTKIRGVLHNNNRPEAQTGDSGGAVFGCNPFTGEYEYVGVLSTAKLKGDTHTNFVNVALFPELAAWINQNTQPCVSTDGYKLKPSDLYQGDHTLDKCKLPTKYYERSGMNSTQICECYEKKDEPSPLKYGCQINLTTQAQTTIETSQAPATTKAQTIIETSQPPTTTQAQTVIETSQPPATTEAQTIIETSQPPATTNKAQTIIETSQPPTTTQAQTSAETTQVTETESTIEPDLTEPTATPKPVTAHTQSENATKTAVNSTATPKLTINQPEGDVKPNFLPQKKDNNLHSLGTLGAFAALGLAAGIGAALYNSKKKNETTNFGPVPTNMPNLDDDLELQTFDIENEL